MKKLIAQIMKFGVVGAIAFVIDYGLMVLLTEVFHVDYLISATISFTVSVIFNYVASMRYVFSHKEGMSRRREFIIFVVLSVIGLGLNDLFMWLGVDLFGIDYRITKLVATFIVMVWNFVTRKIFLDGGDQQRTDELDLKGAAGALVDPFCLIPDRDTIIGRLRVRFVVESTSFDSAESRFCLFKTDGSSFDREPVCMNIRQTKCEDSLISAEIDYAVYFDADAKEFPVLIRDAYGIFPDVVARFPIVLLFDFYMATENAMNQRYENWFAKHKVSVDMLNSQRIESAKGDIKFSLIVPLYKTPLNYFADVLSCMKSQSYQNWELVLVNASSDMSELCRAVQEAADNDPRIVVIWMQKNEGIAGNTNKGIQAATGDFVGFMDHDDMIEPNLLFEYWSAIDANSQVDFLYCDEDLFDSTGRKFDPLFKPDFNLDLLRTHNYVLHLYMIRKTLLDKLDLPTHDLDAAQDYDLTFKACEKARAIAHIPKVLYHWRAHEQSTNIAPESKLHAEEAGRLVVQQHLDRVYPDSIVKTGKLKNTYVVEYPLRKNSKVSIIIPNCDQSQLLQNCVESIVDKAGYDNFEVLIIENSSSESETFELYETLEKNDERIKVLYWVGEGFNFSSLINFGANNSSGDYLLLLNNDTEVITQGFLHKLLCCVQRDEVGVVGPKLVFPDETIQHAGVFTQFKDRDHEPAIHLFRDLPPGNGGYHDRVKKTQNYSVVTGACQLVEKQLFNQLGGYDESFAVAFNDVDFCLKVRRAGLLVVYEAQVEVFHRESVSRGTDSASSEKQQRAQREKQLLFDRWSVVYEESGDPFFNANFNIVSPYCTLVYSRSWSNVKLSLRRRRDRIYLKWLGTKDRPDWLC